MFTLSSHLSYLLILVQQDQTEILAEKFSLRSSTPGLEHILHLTDITYYRSYNLHHINLESYLLHLRVRRRAAWTWTYLRSYTSYILHLMILQFTPLNLASYILHLSVRNNAAWTWKYLRSYTSYILHLIILQFTPLKSQCKNQCCLDLNLSYILQILHLTFYDCTIYTLHILHPISYISAD